VVTSLDSRKSRNSFPGIEKKDRVSRLSSLVNSVFGYNKTEANLQRMFNGYIKTTAYSLFPETLGTFW